MKVTIFGIPKQKNTKLSLVFRCTSEVRPYTHGIQICARKHMPVSHTHTRHAYTHACARMYIRVSPYTHASRTHIHVHACTYECDPTRTTHKFVHARTCQ